MTATLLRRFTPAGLIVTAILAATVSTTAITPIWGTLPTATQVAISTGPGNQTDPHVSGDTAAFTADAAGGLTQIQYYDFQLGVVTSIANDGSFDLLSNVDGSTIIFTRVGSGKQAIYAFDTTAGTLTELDPMDGSRRRSGAIGGNTVAWVDLATGPAGEIYVYDLATEAPAQALTNDSQVDRRMAVSPDGNVIVWEKCATATSDCDIYQAIKGMGGWQVGPLTNTPEHESFPDTNGMIVVYGRTDFITWTSDIHWMPVGGGPSSNWSWPASSRTRTSAGTSSSSRDNLLARAHSISSPTT